MVLTMAHREKLPDAAIDSDMRSELARAIGVLSLNWAYVESALEQMVIEYLDIETAIGEIVTTSLGNRTLINILVSLVHHSEKQANTKAAVLHGIALFDRNRENRNTIMHSMFIGGKDFRFIKRSLKKGVKRDQFLGNPAVIWRVARDIRFTFHYLSTVHAHLMNRKKSRRVALPDKLLLPDKLTILPLAD